MADEDIHLVGVLEENVLSGLVWHPNLAPVLITRIEPEIFSTRNHQRIARAAFEHIKRYNLPPRMHIMDMLDERLKRNDDEAKWLLKILANLEGLAEHLQPQFVLDNLDLYLRARLMQESLIRGSDLLVRGKVDEARELMLSEISPLRKDDDEVGVFLHHNDFLSFFDQADDDVIPCGIEALDERGVSPARKTMFLFIAPAKRGKSWFLIQCGREALRAGKSVLHITLENSTALTCQRYIQCIFSLTKDRAKTFLVPIFKKDNFGTLDTMTFQQADVEGLRDKDKAMITEELKRYRKWPRLLVKKFPTGRLTVAQLEAYLNMLERTHDFMPDEIIIDYPDLMKLDRANIRVDIGRLFTELRGVADERNAALVVVTQGNRISSDAKIVKTTHVAEDFSKIGVADTIITYSRTSQEKKHGIARVMVGGARNAADEWVAMLSQAYDIGQFCLDSVYMDETAENELERVTGDSNKRKRKEDDDAGDE